MLKYAGVLAALVMSSSAAMAADLYVPAAAAAAATPAVTPASAWDGPYIGASVGYSWDTASRTGTELDFSGVLVGGQIGYDVHLSDTVLAGIEGNIDWTNASGSGGTHSTSANWDGSVRGRLGLDLGTVLPYAEAGVAFVNATATTLTTGAQFTDTQFGWTAGVGVESMLAQNVSGNLEIRYDDYGTADYGGTQVSRSDVQARVGLNYHF
jgi:opacity protein-like surface antigen